MSNVSFSLRGGDGGRGGHGGHGGRGGDGAQGYAGQNGDSYNLNGNIFNFLLKPFKNYFKVTFIWLAGYFLNSD